jgi:large subunit ribosomal protein L9
MKVGITMARTKVLLTHDVMDLGEAGDVRVVAGGYARNYLFPRGMAVLATRGALKQAEEIRRAGMIRRAKEREHAESQAAIIRDKRLLFEAKAGETDRLYGSVTSADIADRLTEQTGIEVDRRRIMLEHPIRDLGVHELTIRFMAEVTADFLVAVVREGETWADAEARAAAKAEAEAEEAEAAPEPDIAGADAFDQASQETPEEPEAERE